MFLLKTAALFPFLFQTHPQILKCLKIISEGWVKIIGVPGPGPSGGRDFLLPAGKYINGVVCLFVRPKKL